MKFVHGCLVALMLLSTVQAEEPKPQATEKVVLTDAENNLLTFVNKERARHGLPALKAAETLVISTRRHANWMASNRIMRHVTGLAVGEIIAQGQATSADALRTWLNSPPHRGHVLSRSWTCCGVAGYRSLVTGRVYWCMQFTK